MSAHRRFLITGTALAITAFLMVLQVAGDVPVSAISTSCGYSAGYPGSPPTAGGYGFEPGISGMDRHYVVRAIGPVDPSVSAALDSGIARIDELTGATLVRGPDEPMPPNMNPRIFPLVPGEIDVFTNISSTTPYAHDYGTWTYEAPYVSGGVGRVRGAVISIAQYVTGGVAHSAVWHELGHAVGLDHYFTPYLGMCQMMSYANSTLSDYQSGDRNGLLALAQGGGFLAAPVAPPRIATPAPRPTQGPGDRVPLAGDRQVADTDDRRHRHDRPGAPDHSVDDRTAIQVDGSGSRRHPHTTSRPDPPRATAAPARSCSRPRRPSGSSPSDSSCSTTSTGADPTRPRTPRPGVPKVTARPVRPTGGCRMEITTTVNGIEHPTRSSLALLLVHYVREDLGLTGTNIGCDTSSCGACTVHVNGESVKSCTMLAVQADGQELTTIEGLADGEQLHPMQEAFRQCHGLQCGYCTPGMVMAAVGLLDENPTPHRARGAPRPGGQPLPLHRLPQHREGGVDLRRGTERPTRWRW